MCDAQWHVSISHVWGGWGARLHQVSSTWIVTGGVGGVGRFLH